MCVGSYIPFGYKNGTIQTGSVFTVVHFSVLIFTIEMTKYGGAGPG